MDQLSCFFGRYLYLFHSQQGARPAGDIVDIITKREIPFPKFSRLLPAELSTPGSVSSWYSGRWPALLHTNRHSTSPTLRVWIGLVYLQFIGACKTPELGELK